MKLKKDDLLVEGEDFIVCFMKLVLDLLKGFQHELKVGYISNILANSALKRFMEKERIDGEFTEHGINNLAVAAQKYDVAVFFENNGHGCIYFSQKALSFFE